MGVQLEHNIADIGGAFHRRLASDRVILVQSIAGGQLFQAEAVIRRLAGVAPALGYFEIGRIAARAQDRLHAVGTSQSMLPYLCQLAVEIDRALAADEPSSSPAAQPSKMK